jgi:ribosome maturation factor RimP
VGRVAHFFIVSGGTQEPGRSDGRRSICTISIMSKDLEKMVVREVESLGFECVKYEVVGSSRHPVVRLYIDKPGGVSVGDCTLASRTVGLLLDKEDPFTGKYLLEVSSPGSNRPLTKEEHFQRFEGESAKIQMVSADGEKTTITGQIRSCAGAVLTLDTDDGGVSVELERVKKAYLIDQEYKIDKKMKQSKREKRADRANKRKGDQK